MAFFRQKDQPGGGNGQTKSPLPRPPGYALGAAMNPTHPTPQAMLFDLDGVLVRSHETWLKLMQDASAHFGGRPVTREEFAPLFGQGPEADIAIFGLHCTREELDAYFYENFGRISQGRVWVDPEAAPMLRQLRAHGLRTAIVTNTMRPLAGSLLAQANLLTLFDAVAGADEVACPKPAPDLLTLALARLSLGPADAWMIGDSRYDREAARAAGVYFVGFGQAGDARVDCLKNLPELIF